MKIVNDVYNNREYVKLTYENSGNRTEIKEELFFRISLWQVLEFSSTSKLNERN